MSDLALALSFSSNLPIRFYLNNVTNFHQFTSHKVRHHALQHGDRVVNIDYCDVTSPCPLNAVDAGRMIIGDTFSKGSSEGRRCETTSAASDDDVETLYDEELIC